MPRPENTPDWLQRVFEHVSSAVIVTDSDGLTRWVNQAFTDLTGYPLSELRGRSPGSVLQGPDTCQDTVRLMRERLSQGQGFRTTILNYNRQGHPRHVLLDVQPVGRDGGRPSHFVAFQSHVTEDNESIRLAMSSARQGVWHWDRASREFRVGDEFLAMLGLPGDPGTGLDRFYGYVFAEDRPAVRRWFQRAVRRSAADTGLSFRIKAPSGQIYWLEARGRGVRTDRGGRFVTASGVLRDITQAKASERAMEHLAYFDALTGLPNRRTLDDQISPALDDAGRKGHKAAVLFIDLDGFKQVNDLFGHAFGDSLLCTVAQRLQAGVREQDLVGRISGDEFLVMMNGFDDNEDAGRLAHRLIESVRQPIVVAGQELLVGASIGISVFPDDGEDGERLVRLADLAMYEVKQSGRLGYRFFEQAMNDNAARSMQVETRLRHAVKKHLLHVHYQPLVDVDTRRMIGAEALVRWHDEELGVIPPDQFIPVAERLGLIHALGEWVLETAANLVVRHAGHLPRGFSVSVNVSPVQLGDPQYISRVQGVLERSGAAAGSLMLEVTESALMRDPRRALQKLHELKAMGLGLSIDDFGTGYSSLAALRDLPIDKLKVDRSFVNETGTSDRTRSIVESIIDIGRRLGLQVNT
jgi:diguanylate cyclase (GGDEF)-like protein/PAS domain S-box-containing protein